MNQPIHFNASENTFDFYQLMYGYEPSRRWISQVKTQWSISPFIKWP